MEQYKVNQIWDKGGNIFFRDELTSQIPTYLVLKRKIRRVITILGTRNILPNFTTFLVGVFRLRENARERESGAGQVWAVTQDFLVAEIFSLVTPAARAAQ